MYGFFFSKQEQGQGLVEYALILVLVAIVVMAALAVLGPVIGNVFSDINSSLSEVGTDGGGVPEGNEDWCSEATKPTGCTGSLKCGAATNGVWICEP